MLLISFYFLLTKYLISTFHVCLLNSIVKYRQEKFEQQHLLEVTLDTVFCISKKLCI